MPEGSGTGQDLPPQSGHPGSPGGDQGPQLSPLRLEVPTAGTAGQEDWAKHLKAVCSLDDSSEVGFSFFCLSSYTRMDCRVSCFLRAQTPLGEGPRCPRDPPAPQPLLQLPLGHQELRGIQSHGPLEEESVSGSRAWLLMRGDFLEA